MTRLLTAFALLLSIHALPATGATGPARAWVRFDIRHIISAGAQGAADHRQGRVAMTDDPVRMASISKLAVAIAVMRLRDTGLLNLDRDVSDYLGWQLRHPAFPDQPVTLRRLLSHTSGVRDGIDYALPLDADLAAEMRRPEAWDMEHGPADGYFSYSNLNFPIIAAVMEAVTRQRFDRIMADELFDPLKIDACFNWTTCSMRAVRHALVLYNPDGSAARDDLKGHRPACGAIPARDGTCDVSTYRLGQQGAFFSPQGGMRISPRGLARIGQLLLGARPDILKTESLAEMTRMQWRYNGQNGDTEGGFHCAFGLGVMFLAVPDAPAECRDDPFGDGIPRFGHAGEAYGLRSGLFVDAVSKKGVAFYVTGLPDDAPKGRSAFTDAEEEMIASAQN